MTAPTLNSQSLGNVESIRWRKSADIDQIAIPGSDSSGATTWDYGGVIRNITVSGSFTGTSYSAVRTSVQAINNIINGNQTSSVSFTSDELGDGIGGNGSIQVKIVSFDVNWEIPSNRAIYTLELIEGS